MSKPDWAERIQRSRNKMFERGVTAERERIIKIIEHFIKDWRVVGFTQAPELFERLIALIKGETE